MKIECRIKRKGGSEIELFGTDYHFLPEDPKDPKSPHVCEVTDEVAVQRFLSITEGYKIFGAADPEPEPEVEEGRGSANEWIEDGKVEMVDDEDMVDFNDEPIIEDEPAPDPKLYTIAGMSVVQARKAIKSLDVQQLDQLKQIEESTHKRRSILKFIDETKARLAK